MGNPIRSLTPLNHRLDHDLFEDTAKVHYKEGVITDFGTSKTNPLTLDDTCTLELTEGGRFVKVPIFYHCRPGYYDEAVATQLSNKALKHAAWGFRAGHKVVVMLREDKVVAVLGHSEDQVYLASGDGAEIKKAPRRCLDIFRLQWHRTIGSGDAPTRPPDMPTTPGWQNWFGFSESWHSLHYQFSSGLEYSSLDQPPVEPDGDVAEYPHRAKHIMGMREQQYGTMVYYLGDWMIRLGPVAIFFNVYSIGMPAPITGSIAVSAGIWTPERDAIWLENARKKEQLYGTGGGSFAGLNPALFTDFPYVNTYIQNKLTATFMSRFSLTGGGLSPKWILSEFWYYDWDRIASVPGTPNTPAG